jgi:(p)ppGpp synthase/HD superfamily hydrolase
MRCHPDGHNEGAMLYSDRLLVALRTAAELHAGQRRKGTDIPYLAHLLGTCAIALEYGADEDEAIAALLDDAIEGVRRPKPPVRAWQPSPERVLAIVEACTGTDVHPKPPWRERKLRYLAHLATADRSALRVSAADKLHNARAIVADLRRVGPAVWDRFNPDAGRDGSLWYYRSLVEGYRANPAHDPDLTAELDRTVTEMERLAAGAG